MDEYSLGRKARIDKLPLDSNPFEKGIWRHTEWQCGWLDHKHRMEWPMPVTMRQKIKF